MAKTLSIGPIIGITLGTPVFFTKNFSIFQGGGDDIEFSMPISVIILSFIILIYSPKLLRTIFLKQRFSITSIIFCLGFLYVLIISLIIGFGDFHLLALYYHPIIVGLSLAYYARISDIQPNLIFQFFVLASASFAFLHIVASIIELGLIDSFSVRGVDSIFGIFSIYQKHIYYSTILSLASIACWYVLHGPLKIIVFIVLFIDILICGAREALIISLAALVLGSEISASRFITRLLLSILAIAGVGALIINYSDISIDKFVFLDKIISMATSNATESLTAGRSEAISLVLSYFDLDFALFALGSGFITTIAEGMTPHNQYIEWYIRGGFIFTAANTLLLLYALSKKAAWGVEKYLGLILLVVLLISNNVNTPFRAPFTSVFIWFCIGLALIKRSLIIKAPKRIVKSNTNETGCATMNTQF